MVQCLHLYHPQMRTSTSRCLEPRVRVLYGKRREKAGLSVEQAAGMTCIGAQRWSAMEAGDWLPETRQQFHLIASALDIDWDTMVGVVMMCRGAWGLS